MRIDRLELIGFKSFAEKTTFSFHPGITCIVGPNGCGKSNVVDAFRWVLGEQSAKSLRGENMEQVIFNGSASKKPKGMAEVTMVISGLNGNEAAGENGEGSVDFAFVTRRLYRSGDSEYILNKNQCRLKDVKDLFLDTGLEIKSYSILEQDRIAEILNAKPQERRFLIEEVAGVMKYNVRKREALSKLESSRSNLQRINDIISEVKKQINFLDRLARKAERYKRLISEISAIELKIAKRDHQSLKESLEGILNEYGSLREEESFKRAELSKIETQNEMKRLELLEKEKALEQLEAQFQDMEREIAGLEKSIAVMQTENDNYNDYLGKLYQQGEEYVKKRADLLIRQEELRKIGDELSAEIGVQNEFLSEKNGLIISQEERLAEKEELLNEKRRELFRTSEELSALRNEQNSLRSSLESLNHREASAIADAENLRKILSDADSSLNDLETNLTAKNNDLLLCVEKKEILVKEFSEIKMRIEELRDAISGLKEELASDLSRIESLKEFVFDEIVGDFFSENPDLKLLSSISDVIEVDGEYEKAIESVLSEKINAAVLPSKEHIEAAVSAVKERGLSRTAFISAAFRGNGEVKSVPEGSLGCALSFVRTREGFSHVVECLLHNVFIVSDLRTALDLISSNDHSIFVTTDGEVVEPSGIVVAGEIKGVLRKKREMRKLETAAENKKETIEIMQVDLHSSLQLAGEKELALKDIEATIIEWEKEISLLDLTAQKFREEKERRNRKLEHLILEIEQIMSEKESINSLIANKDSEIQSVDSRRAEIEGLIASLQEESSGARLNIDRLRSEITDFRLSITSLKERLDSTRKDIESTIKELTENDQKRDFLSEEINSIKSGILKRDEELHQMSEKIRSVVSVADELRRKISERKEVLESDNQAVMTAEHGLKRLRNEIETYAQKIAELEVRKAEHKLKMESLSENVRQNFGLDIASIDMEVVIDEEVERLDALREKIKELGPVNLGTLEEYEELRNRYEFLKNQQEDLTRSIRELEEAITKINSTTRRKLIEAFESLKTKFSEVFITLFGGGRAELVMTDENNILETGIDIIAQPPGKKLQNINLLSGGEKTLTALALLFASFLLKPTPLCILDEADSALDEANTEKFAKMLRELSRDTQFIVVTHNKNTMGVADYIYGITMEEAGISKVLSMQLIEA
ncbi:MAG: chromosome segregation protein SMC [Nitrospirota bacterium]